MGIMGEIRKVSSKRLSYLGACLRVRDLFYISEQADETVIVKIFIISLKKKFNKHLLLVGIYIIHLHREATKNICNNTSVSIFLTTLKFFF